MITIRNILRNAGLLLLCVCFSLLSTLTGTAESAPTKKTGKEKSVETDAGDFGELDSLLEFSTLPASKTGKKTTDEKIKELAEKSMALRDPLWPIGFKPKPKVVVTKKDEQKKKKPPKPINKPHWEEAVRTLSIRGIMSAGGGKYMAMINGQVAGEGDKISIVYRGRKYSWKVKTISEDGVAFQKIEHKTPPKKKAIKTNQ